jgi:hypothetical protein
MFDPNHLTSSSCLPSAQTQKVVPFVIGCPACYHNFVHFW